MKQTYKDIRFHVAEALSALSERHGDDDFLRSIRVADFGEGECERLIDALRTVVDKEGYQCERCEVVFVPCVSPTAVVLCADCEAAEVTVVTAARDGVRWEGDHDMHL